MYNRLLQIKRKNSSKIQKKTNQTTKWTINQRSSESIRTTKSTGNQGLHQQ